MELINAFNLNPISICELNTKFNFKSHADWSKANLISIVASDGIYILNPQLNNHQGPFEIELIRNPIQTFKHQALIDHPSFDSKWAYLNNRQYIEAFSDTALNTNIESLSLELYPRRFKFAKWSPPIDTYPRQCLLATITTDYQLLVYKRSHMKTWSVQVDLSNEYDKLWAQLHNKTNSTINNASGDNHNQPPIEENINFQRAKKDLHSLSFCNACWKLTSNNKLLLLATTIPGDIVVWQFLYSTNNDNNNPKFSEQVDVLNNEVQVDISMIFKTDVSFINSMSLYKELLIVSSQDGQVLLYDLTINFNEIEKQSSSTEQQPVLGSKTLNLIDLPSTVTLWHRDNIEVSDFYLQPTSLDTFRIVMSKGTNICWCIIQYTQKNGDQLASLAISSTFSAIDGKDPEVSLHQTPAIWLRAAGNRKAVLIAEDGSFFQLDFADNNQDTIPDFSAIKTGKVDFNRYVPRGLCTSPNGYLLTMIAYIALVYEPSKIECPTKLVLLPTINDNTFTQDSLKNLIDENWLENNNVQSPMDMCDLIDYLRSLIPLFTANQYGEIYKFLRDAVDTIQYPKNKIQMVKLKIVTFLLLKLCEQPIYKLINALDFDKELYDSILLYNVEKVLEIVFASSNKKEVNSRQYLSLCNYFEWLNKSINRHWLRDKFSKKFETLQKKLPAKSIEYCPICNSKIPFHTSRFGICTVGHRFDRCGRSLLIINLESSDEIVCDHCKRHYMTELVWPTTSSSNLWLCSYCQ